MIPTWCIGEKSMRGPVSLLSFTPDFAVPDSAFEVCGDLGGPTGRNLVFLLLTASTSPALSNSKHSAF